MNDGGKVAKGSHIWLDDRGVRAILCRWRRSAGVKVSVKVVAPAAPAIARAQETDKDPMLGCGCP